MLRALILLALSSLLPACGGCGVTIDRSATAPADGLFHGLVVGGTKPDGAFVVALRENGPDELDATVVSLGEEPRACSLGPAIWYDTVQQGGVFSLDGDLVDDRPARIAAIEGKKGDTSGTLRVFDASCEDVLEGPAIELPVRWAYVDGKPAAWTARTVDGALVWIDPWEPSIRTLGEHVSAYGRLVSTTFWLVEDGVLVVRDAEGNTLASAGSDVTEVDGNADGTELAFVDEGSLFTMKVADSKPALIATKGTPCKPEYIWFGKPMLAYREDCEAGTLALLDSSTGEKRLLSSAVSDVFVPYAIGNPWLFFHREPPGGEDELWAVREASDPVLVGKGPDPALYKIVYDLEHGYFVLLDDDGDTGTLGAWTPDGGFEPILDGVGWPMKSDGLLTAVAEREGDVGAFVALDLDTLDSALRADGVPWWSVRFSRQAPVIGYLRDWNTALRSGTFEVWIEPTGQRAVVDYGVSEIEELLWPKPGVVYAVRTPGREGLWTAYPHL